MTTVRHAAPGRADGRRGRACISLVVVVVAAVPWPSAWRRFVRSGGDRWS